jgi:transcriptional regulator with XRE-family HTH domain
MRTFSGDQNHPIARYASVRGLTLAELARRAGIPAPRLSEILNGRRARLSWDNSLKIQHATGNEITASELMNYRAPPPRRKNGSSR